MADPEIRKRNPDDEEEESPERLRPLGATLDPEAFDRLRSSARLQPIATSNAGESERLQPVRSTTLQQPDNQNLLDRPRSSLLSFHSREEARRHGEDLSAPAGGPAVIPQAGSKGAAQVELDRLADEKATPWGSPENHPGRLGKIGHVLGTIGNVAGDMLIPQQMEQIPGSDLNREVQKEHAEKQLGTAATRESEEGLRSAQEENLRSETRQRDTKADQSLVTDAQGNVTGWKGQHGELHSLDEAGTPQAIKDIASETQNKMLPKFEQDQNGNIVALKTDKDGKTSSEVVYKGDPKLETDLVHGHLVNGAPHTLLVNKKTGQTIKDLGAEKMPAQNTEHGIEYVRAKDDQGKIHLMSQDDAKAKNWHVLGKASDADVDKAKTHTVALNEMQAKLNDVVASRKALDQDAAQRVIIARALRSLDKFTTIGQLADAGIMDGATPQSQEYVQSVLSLREGGLALPKEITGTGRTSEIQASALWQTIPSGASLNGEYALKQAKKFQAVIDRLKERPELVEGLHVEDPHPEVASERKQGTAPQRPQGVPDNAVWNEQAKKWQLKKTP